MEKVVDLFKSFRNKEIEYDELFGELTKMLSEDPHFSGQAVSALDKAQQQTPIPVTDFINLRAKVENTADTFHQQEVSHGPADGESTMIFAGEEATSTTAEPTPTAGEATLVAAPEPEPAAAPEPIVAELTPPANNGMDDYEDEATVIMPMPTRQPAAPQPVAPKPAAAAGSMSDHDATLIAPTPVAEPATPTPSNDEATLIAAPTPSQEPTPVPPSPTPKAANPAQQATKTKVTTQPKPPIALIGGGIAAVLVIVFVIALWPSSDEATETPPIAAASDTQQEASPWSSSPQTQTEPIIEAPAEVIETPATEQMAESQALEVQDTIDAIATTDTLEQASIADEANAVETETTTVDTLPVEPVVKDEAYFVAAIEKAVAEKNLSPAEQEGTATYYLVELIKLDQNSDKVSEARTLISKKHLALAKESRGNNQWDAAQQHLDDALKVRLPDTYLPE